MRDTHPAHVSGMFDDRERGVFVPIDRVRAFGGWTPAIVYSQLAYWHQKMRRPFYKTAASLAEELALSERTVERALAKLRRLGVIETSVKKVQNTPTNHFSVNYLRHDQLVLRVRRERMDSAILAESDSAILAESMDSVKMAESYTGEYLQELTDKTLSASPSASADTAAKASTSTDGPPLADMSGVPLSASLTPLPFSATASASPTPPSPKQAGSKSRQVDSQLLDALVATYNEHRTSDKGSLPQVRVRSPKLTADLTKFAAAMQASGLDPLEALAALTSHLARNDHYLGKGGGTRYGLANALVNWHKHIDAALEAKAREQPQVKLTPGAVMTLIEGMHKETVRLLDAEPQDGLVRVERLRRRSDGVWVAYHESRVAVKNLRPDDPERR